MLSVHPDIALGMPLRILRHADDCGQFGQKVQPATVLQEGQPQRRLHRSGGPLEPLLAHPFDGQFRETRTNGPAQLERLRSGLQPKATGKLQAAQHPQRVFGKRRARVPQSAGLEIGTPAVGIDQFTAPGIPKHRVDGEVAPGGSLQRTQFGIELDVEALVSRPALRITTWHRKIPDRSARMGEFHHAKRLAHRIGPAVSGQHGRQLRIREAVHLDVEVGDRNPQQPVPHATAYQVRTLKPRSVPQQGQQRRWQDFDHGKRAGSGGLQRHSGKPRLCRRLAQGSWSHSLTVPGSSASTGDNMARKITGSRNGL